MKLFIRCFVFAFSLIALQLHAQLIKFSVVTADSDCNGFNTGTAAVNVIPERPPYSYLWNTGSTANFVSGLAPGNYSVSVTDSSGITNEIAVLIGERPCKIAAENIFTPNDDMINDTWQIYNLQYYPDCLILVYNRWGQKIFEHKGEYTPWDGKDLFDVPVPDNSYYYIIYGDKKDDNSIIKGSVSILR